MTTTTALDDAPVTGDRVLLERLVAILLDNAERYNIPGGTIAISTTTHDATSVLRVVNTGAVVPADMVERLFLPFTRLGYRTRHEGFGLGLAQVSSIATVHNGTVDATAPHQRPGRHRPPPATRQRRRRGSLAAQRYAKPPQDWLVAYCPRS